MLAEDATSPTMLALSRSRCGMSDAALPVEFADLAEVVDAIEELQPRRVALTGISASFCFDLQPDGHRINAHAFPRQARDEDVAAVLVLNERTKAVRDLEPAFVVDFGWGVAP